MRLDSIDWVFIGQDDDSDSQEAVDGQNVLLMAAQLAG